MATKEPKAPQNGSSKHQESTPTDLANSVQDLHLGEGPPDDDSSNDAPRPVFIYTRPQLLTILKSPLVNPPANMPNLVQWLGPGDSETSVKKDADNSALGAPRDRRFRRDNEDGDGPLRPSFRSSLSQPSQMGNFKHQSLRTTERDRDRDLDREHDKESNERLRNLSDKYDRERLNLSSNGARAKDRDAAPHLPSGTTRVATQNNGTTRRSEQREGSKKKPGESSEDWRKGADPSRPGRDDKREDRERARSRPRDSSKTRREPSATRRDRDREETDRDRYRRVDRERDDYRKEREAYRREREREEDNEDPRRWRDDGRRDERLANARRERDRGTERERDPNWDDRRWTVVEDRDTRSKRAGRDRRQNEEGKEREERKDREREREKEKEPAWMDSSAPTTGGTGIIGGRAADGEIDQIQAWKKTVKEREQKEKEKPAGKGAKGKPEPEPPAELPLAAADAAVKPLDEIQLFKLIMKKESEKKMSSSPSGSPSLPPAPHPTMLSSSESSDSTKPASDPRDLLAMLAGTTLVPSDAATDKATPSVPSVLNLPPPEANAAGSSATTPQFQPPPGSRLLAMRNPSTQSIPMVAKSPVGVIPGSPGLTDPHSHSPVNPVAPGNYPGAPVPQMKPAINKADMGRQGFTPFEEQNRMAYGLDDPHIAQEVLRRQSGALGNEGINDLMALEHANGSNFAPAGRGGGGSRFAKFFDNNKTREPELVGGGMKGPNAPGFVGSAPGLHQRPDPSFAPGGMMHSNSGGSVGEQRSIEDLYAMLSNSAQGQRGGLGGPMPNPPIRSSHSPSLHLIQQQQMLQHQQQQQLLSASRLEALYDSRLDDRNFVPDGMVPGLRTAPPPRRRNDGLDALEEQMQFNARHPGAQQRALEQLYNGSVPGMYQQVAVGRNAGIPLQQQQFRGGPSPINHNALHNPQQRLPPGLANLGGRPPHDGMVGMHNSMLGGGPQQQFNNFAPGGGMNNFNGPQRGGPLSPHQLSGGPVGQHMSPLGHPGNQGLGNQLQGMVGLNGGGGLRGNGGYSSPPIQGGQGLGNAFGMRQQQPQSMMAPPSHPSHLQQQPQGFASSGSQPAHELMALLMGGQLRGE